ncbi:SH3 domain-containing protein [Kordiimonas sp. SCSIO 12603]|uniref:SH3 domain-containing protein n=1 Tax=Kordiimonas sp. SCSIO 12603 TaxID=2829596 RepID=UPI0021058751|nr:SH3 domain-containing protein [Kordiimonas sp. SCSIO 12603]UTW59661.1 SH3 domain-containing protein [Kordiimonas sp. SCSIO 12603]
MPLLFTNIAITLLGLGATLSAFGGETWLKGDAPLVQRITKRGWISLVCILSAIVLGVIKEVSQHQSRVATAKEQKWLNNEIIRLTNDLTEAANILADTEAKISEQQLASLEAAFQVSHTKPGTADDDVVHLRGQEEVIPRSRHSSTMQLYWGDEFKYTIIAPKASANDLSKLALRVGDRTYPLHESPTKVTYERSIRIYGTDPRPMEAKILNPEGLKDVMLKITVLSTDASRGQKKFRRIVLSGIWAEIAKKMYKRTNADILNIRFEPDTSSNMVGRLTRGSFVRVLQSQNMWTEVATPEGRQGWVRSEYIVDIE